MTRRAQEVDWVSGACLLVRRADAEAAGLLDERYFMYTRRRGLLRRGPSPRPAGALHARRRDRAPARPIGRLARQAPPRWPTVAARSPSTKSTIPDGCHCCALTCRHGANYPIPRSVPDSADGTHTRIVGVALPLLWPPSASACRTVQMRGAAPRVRDVCACSTRRSVIVPPRRPDGSGRRRVRGAGARGVPAPVGPCDGGTGQPGQLRRQPTHLPRIPSLA